MLDGKVDNLPEHAFFYAGGIDEVSENAEKMASDRLSDGKHRAVQADHAHAARLRRRRRAGDCGDDRRRGGHPAAARAVSGRAQARVVYAPTSSRRHTQRLELATGEGFMQALPDRVTVLVDEALRFEDVDVARPARSWHARPTAEQPHRFRQRQAAPDRPLGFTVKAEASPVKAAWLASLAHACSWTFPANDRS